MSSGQVVDQFIELCPAIQKNGIERTRLSTGPDGLEIDHAHFGEVSILNGVEELFTQFRARHRLPPSLVKNASSFLR